MQKLDKSQLASCETPPTNLLCTRMVHDDN